MYYCYYYLDIIGKGILSPRGLIETIRTTYWSSQVKIIFLLPCVCASCPRATIVFFCNTRRNILLKKNIFQLNCMEGTSFCHSQNLVGCQKTDQPLYLPTTTYLIGLASGHFSLCSHNGTLIAAEMRGSNNGLHSRSFAQRGGEQWQIHSPSKL